MKEVKAIIDRFEGDLAVLKINGQEVLWPKKELTKELNEGDTVVFQIRPDRRTDKENDEKAKDILGGLLNHE